jgi:hypothetical protein
LSTNLPWAQAAQAVAPLPLCTLPGAQGVHSSEEFLSVKVPTEQGSQV